MMLLQPATQAALFSVLANLSPSIWFRGPLGTFQDTGLTTPATTNGATVEGWADQSGNANNATFNQAAQTLATGGSGINGLNAINWNGANGMLLCGSTVVCSGTWTLWMVGTRATASIFCCGNNNTSTTSHLLIFSDNNIYVVNDAGTAMSTAYAGSNGTIAVRVRRDASNLIKYFATGMVSEATIGTALSGAMTFTSIARRGSNFNSGGNLVGEVLLATTDLVTTKLAAVNSYEALLNTEWGVQP